MKNQTQLMLTKSGEMAYGMRSRAADGGRPSRSPRKKKPLMGGAGLTTAGGSVASVSEQKMVVCRRCSRWLVEAGVTPKGSDGPCHMCEVLTKQLIFTSPEQMAKRAEAE